MRIPIAVLTLVLSACASAPEKGYSYTGQTPAVRPAAPAFRPELDAPHTRGQPGAIDPDRKTLPRGPDKRVLPPESRPGIWASDGDARRALILRIRRPLPGRVPAGGSKELWARCWQDVQEQLLADPEVLMLSELEMECLRNSLLGTCGEHFIGRWDTAVKRKDAKRGDMLFLAKWPGPFSYREWEATFTERRNERRCEDSNAWTPRVGRLYGRLSNSALDTKGWPRSTE